MSGDQYRQGDRVEYIAAPVHDAIIETGDNGVVVKAERGWVRARWPRSGVHSVPIGNVRPALPPVAYRVVGEVGKRGARWLHDAEDRLFVGGRELDPYWESGCHPDIVSRVWDDLGSTLPADCRARAAGVPVLAHPTTDRIFAAARGTQYMLWLTPEDFAAAQILGGSTLMRWSGGSITELREEAGEGWLWGRWYEPEPSWLHRSFEAAAAAS